MTRTLALVPWDIRGNDSGGKQRCVELLTALPNVTTFAVSWTNEAADTSIGRMPYRVIPAGTQAIEQAQRLFKQGIHSYDVIPTLCVEKMMHLRESIERLDPDLIILEHPWLQEFTGGRPYIYDAHNFETHSTAQLWGKGSLDFDLVKDIEHQTIIEAEHITYASTGDWASIQTNWATPDGTHIPNGTHIPATVKKSQKTRNLVFVGSLYGPNVTAAQTLANMAHLLPEYEIHLVGDSSALVETTAPNVVKHGKLSHQNLALLLEQSHMFVNLITQGSGTHLKIPQALAYGLPVVTLPAGARGYETDCVIAPTLAYVPEYVRIVTSNWAQESDAARDNARKYDWANIRQDFAETIHAFQ